MSDTVVDVKDEMFEEPAAATITFALPPGIYSFKIKSGGSVRGTSALALPAVKIDLAPADQDATVEFLSAPTTHNNYLAYEDDVVVARVAGGEALFMLVSLKLPGQEALALDIVRLNAPAETEGLTAAQVIDFTPDWSGLADDQRPVAPAGMSIYLQSGKRIDFVDSAGCSLDDLQWIEAFAIAPGDDEVGDILQYAGIVEGQVSTDWCSAGTICGIPGSNVPLQGFAVRIKPDTVDGYDCHYYGVFASGAVAGPISNGALCASDEADDPLVRLDVRLVAPIASAKYSRGVADMQRV